PGQTSCGVKLKPCKPSSDTLWNHPSYPQICAVLSRPQTAWTGAISSAALAKTPNLAGDKSPISIGNALLEPHARTPAESLKPANIQEFTRGSIRLADILHDVTLEAHNLGHQRGELGNGEVFA